jgi:hypothetical protein
MKETLLQQKSRQQAKALQYALSLPVPEGRSNALQDVSDWSQQEVRQSVAVARRVLRDEPFALGLFEAVVVVYEQRLAAPRKKAQEFDKKLRELGGSPESPEPRWAS